MPSIRLETTVVTVLLLLAHGTALAQSPWSESYRSEAEGDYSAAIDALESIIDADSRHEFAILRRAWLQYLNGDFNASIRDYRLALEINQLSLEAELGVTLPLLAQRRWREAAATAQHVISIAPWNYYAHIRLMVAQEGMQRWQELARHASETAARFPSDATILVYLARAEAAQGNRTAAMQAYTKVLERIPEHEEAQAYINAEGR
jgi:tetratricopeptide (TPR) repeat protein